MGDWSARTVVAVGCLLVVLTAPGQAPVAAPEYLVGKERAAFLERVESAMSGVKSFAATFVQEKHLRVFKDVVKSEGQILFSQPDQLRWEITAPFRSILVVAGADVAKFEVVGGERRALKLGRGKDVLLVVMSRIREWFRGRFSEDEYRVDVAAGPGPRIVFTPRDERMGRTLTSIQLELTPDLSAVETVTILEQGEDKTVMRFRLAAKDVAFPRGTFATSEPVDVDVSALGTANRDAPPK